MNYHEYYSVDLVNGPGLRSTLFVSGCIHACEGCYNEETWNPKSGNPYTKELEDRIIADLLSESPKRQGLSLSGGDPLHPKNLETIFNLVVRIKKECPDKDIWLWSGFTFEEIFNGESQLRKNLVSCIDILVDGKFVKELADPRLRYRGSSNQKVWKNTYGVFTEVIL